MPSEDMGRPLEGDIQSFSVDSEMEALIEAVGEAATLRVYGLEGVARFETDDRGRKTVVCPHADPRQSGRFINVLPRPNMDELIKVLGGETQATAFYRTVRGYKGDLRFERSQGEESRLVISSFADMFRSLPKAVRIGMVAVALAVAGGIFKETSLGNDIEHRVEAWFADDEDAANEEGR